MFMSSMGASGMCMAMPDVCNTPTPAGPVPVPYPNMGQTSMSLPSNNSVKVLADMMPTCTIMSQIPLSQGDNAGVAMGVASGLVMGPVKYNMGSTKVLLEGKPATRLANPTGHNGMSPNAVGTMIAPSQVKVMVMG